MPFPCTRANERVYVYCVRLCSSLALLVSLSNVRDRVHHMQRERERARARARVCVCREEHARNIGKRKKKRRILLARTSKNTADKQYAQCVLTTYNNKMGNIGRRTMFDVLRTHTHMPLRERLAYTRRPTIADVNDLNRYATRTEYRKWRPKHRRRKILWVPRI